MFFHGLGGRVAFTLGSCLWPASQVMEGSSVGQRRLVNVLSRCPSVESTKPGLLFQP